MRIARTLPLLLLGLPGGCQDLTSLTPERVPPPDRTRVPEGTLDDPTDPCGALDVEAPRRLSATRGDSDGVRMALLPRPGAEAWVGVAWLEHRLLGPEEAPAQIAVQTLLEDGVPLGDTQRFDAGDPESVEIVAIPGEDLFLVATGDRDRGSFMTVLSPTSDPAEVPPELDLELPDLDQPRVALALGHGYVVGLDAAAAGPRSIRILDVTITGRQFAVEPGVVPRIAATDVAVATNGAETWLAWNDGVQVRGAALRKTEGGDWEIREADEHVIDGHPGSLRRAHGTIDLAVAFAAWGMQDVRRLDADDWRSVGSGTADQERTESLAVTRGESGTRWAIARAFEPGDGSPAEIRIERVRPSKAFCETPGECVRVTTDRLQSAGPEILWVDGGYLVAWSDREEIGQTDVFVALARCRSTTTAPAGPRD